jgi:hypothetical protein
MGNTYTLADAPFVREITARFGGLTEDEAALVRTLTPQDFPSAALAEHMHDLVDLLCTIREDEAMAEYVYAIAPAWDGTVETLLLAARVTTACTRHELELRVPALVG